MLPVNKKTGSDFFIILFFFGFIDIGNFAY